MPALRTGQEQRVAAYVAFADKTLEMARRKPRTAVEMAAVQGVGEGQYGDIFLDVIRQHGADSTSSAA